MKMDPIVIEDNDDDVEVLGESSLIQRRNSNSDQQIELLMAMYNSSEPTPAQYRRFFIRAKELKPHFSEDVITDAWVTAYKASVRRTAHQVNELAQSSYQPAVVDLTNSEGNHDPLSPSTSQRNIFPQSTATTSIDISSDESNDDSADKLPVIYVVSPSGKHAVEPIALFKNPLCHADKTIEHAFSFWDIGENSATGPVVKEKAKSLGSVSPVVVPSPSRASLANSVQQMSNNNLVTRNTANKRKRSESAEATTGGRMLSKSELKKFKKKQLKKRRQETRNLVQQEMELVHNRLVDIIIPKFFNKDLLNRCATKDNNNELENRKRNSL